MPSYLYPVALAPDSNGTLLVTFPDVPEAITAGENAEDALVQGLEALEAAFDLYFNERRVIPDPSPVEPGQPVVRLPALVAAKRLLANEAVTQKMRKAELARRLNVNQVQVDRLFKFGHGTKIEAIEAALAVLGKRLEVRIEDEEATKK